MFGELTVVFVCASTEKQNVIIIATEKILLRIMSEIFLNFKSTQNYTNGNVQFITLKGYTILCLLFTTVVVNAFSPITGIVCLICLVFLFFESAFGICLGCIVYKLFYREKAQYCPGELCDPKSEQAIQKSSQVQLLIVFLFIGYIFLMDFLFNDAFKEKPYDLFGIFSSILSE